MSASSPEELRVNMFIRQRGLTLIELMVTLAISGVILAGVVNIYTSSLTQSKLTGNLTAVQESGRFALNLIAHDVRMAGFSGCLAYDALEDANNPNTTTPNAFWGLYTRGGANFVNQAMLGIQGWEATGTGLGTAVSLTPTRTGTSSGWTTSGGNTLVETYAEAISGSDILRVWTSGDKAADISVVTPAAASLTLTAPAGHGIVAGDLVLFSTCGQRVLGQVCAVNNQQLTISQGAAGNCNNAFRSNMVVSSDADGAEIFTYRDVTYFIGKRDTATNTPPSLYRAVGATAREIVEGVENMQILYGVDLNHTSGNVRTASTYVTAAEVGSRWGDVVSVRISLLMRSFETGLATGTNTFNFNNTSVSSTDGYVRQVYSTTIAVRNRGIGEVAGL